MLTMGSVQVQAQGLGGLLKKAKKVLDTVKEQTTTTSSDSKSQSSTASSTASGGQDGQTTQAIPLQGGGTLYNPFEKKLEVEFVGLYGTNKSMNFGDVSVVLKLKVKTVCDKDISKAAKEKLDPKIARAILRSYARNVSTMVDKSTILADVTANNDSLSRSTFDKYVAALEKLFVIQDIGAWNPSIRSKTAIRSGEKRSFCDPSVAVASLGLGPGQLLTQLKTFGFIFECMCVRDLKVYSAPLDGEISHYRDRYGLEADIVLHLEDGRYALIECKLGSAEIDDGAGHLKELVGSSPAANTPIPVPTASTSFPWLV